MLLTPKCNATLKNHVSEINLNNNEEKPEKNLLYF